MGHKSRAITYNVIRKRYSTDREPQTLEEGILTEAKARALALHTILQDLDDNSKVEIEIAEVVTETEVIGHYTKSSAEQQLTPPRQGPSIRGDD